VIGNRVASAPAFSVAQLAHPEWFGPVIWTALAIGLLLAGAAWRARRRRLVLMGTRRVRTAGKGTSDLALWIALCAIGIALLGPRIGHRWIEASANGIDLVLVLDISRSMDAQDTPPSRLDRARRGVEELLVRLEPSDRVALAVFAGRGVLLTPLSPDHEALGEWIATLDTDLIRPASSNLAAGIRAGVEAFEVGSERPRVIVVASDGEDPNQDTDLGIAEALAARARVIAIALGSELGSAIPTSGAPLRDRTGRVVVTRRHGDRLAQLAEATAGVSIPTDEWGGFDFDAVAEEIRRDAGTVPGEPTLRRVPAIRVAPFAALALAVLLAEGLPRRRVSLRRRAAAASGLALAALSIGAGPPRYESPLDAMRDAAIEQRGADDSAPTPEAAAAWVRREPHDARALIALGHARFAHGNPSGAASAFAAAALYATDARSAAHSHYGLGVARLENGDFEAARDAFFDALAFDPTHAEARFNLEWALAALVRNPPDDDRPDPPADPDSGSSADPDEPDTAEREPPAAPQPSPSAPGPPRDSTPVSADPQPAQLTEQQQLRSLARVTDDLERSIRAAMRSDGDPDERREHDSW